VTADRSVSTDALWEQFARENAEYFILTEGGSVEWDPERFFALGDADAERILEGVRPWLRGFDSAVDIGCGVGRLAIPMARSFRSVAAIDVSPTMLAKCEENCAERGVDNVSVLHSSRATAGAFSADLVYSHLVLQHIEDYDVIRAYVALTRSWLRPTGVASLQFDTRDASTAYRLSRRVPDALLPRTRRRGIRRIRRARADVLATLRDADLEVVRELEPATERHVVVAVVADAPQ
jgi:SAM-dependent methyltransferase